MRLVNLSFLLAALTLSVGAGCAAPSADANADGAEASESDLSRATSDRAIKGKLRGILSGITFTSESDFEYVVFEGDVVSEGALDESLVRQNLRAAVQTNNSSGRDILPASCRARALNVDEAVADGDTASASDDQEDTYVRHDRQLGIALKVMRSQLKSVVGFTFGTNGSGDMDDVGTVLYVYVGISKTTGKLIAIMTEAVYT